MSVHAYFHALLLGLVLHGALPDGRCDGGMEFGFDGLHCDDGSEKGVL
jgi:hypothetical protein